MHLSACRLSAPAPNSLDASYNSKLYTNLVRKGVFNKYTVDYAMRHRDELKRDYPQFNQYNQHFAVTDTMIEAVKKIAANEKVEWNEDEFKRSEKYIRLQIKALIARNVWEMQQYYEVTLKEDPTISKALEVLSSERKYNRWIR